MSELTSLHALVHGRVQGVYFRDFTRRQARKLGISGYVRNLRDWKTVEVQAEGEKSKLDELIDLLRVGPPGARVEKIETTWSAYTGRYDDFSVRF